MSKNSRLVATIWCPYLARPLTVLSPCNVSLYNNSIYITVLYHCTPSLYCITVHHHWTVVLYYHPVMYHYTITLYITILYHCTVHCKQSIYYITELKNANSCSCIWTTGIKLQLRQYAPAYWVLLNIENQTEPLPQTSSSF